MVWIFGETFVPWQMKLAVPHTPPLHTYPHTQEISEKLSTALSALVGIPGLQGLTNEQLLGRLQTLPEEEEELRVAAATMAYFKVGGGWGAG